MPSATDTVCVSTRLKMAKVPVTFWTTQFPAEAIRSSTAFATAWMNGVELESSVAVVEASDSANDEVADWSAASDDCRLARSSVVEALNPFNCVVIPATAVFKSASDRLAVA